MIYYTLTTPPPMAFASEALIEIDFNNPGVSNEYAYTLMKFYDPLTAGQAVVVNGYRFTVGNGGPYNFTADSGAGGFVALFNTHPVLSRHYYALLTSPIEVELKARKPGNLYNFEAYDMYACTALVAPPVVLTGNSGSFVSNSTRAHVWCAAHACTNSTPGNTGGLAAGNLLPLPVRLQQQAGNGHAYSFNYGNLLQSAITTPKPNGTLEVEYAGPASIACKLLLGLDDYTTGNKATTVLAETGFVEVLNGNAETGNYFKTTPGYPVNFAAYPGTRNWYRNGFCCVGAYISGNEAAYDGVSTVTALAIINRNDGSVEERNLGDLARLDTQAGLYYLNLPAPSVEDNCQSFFYRIVSGSGEVVVADSGTFTIAPALDDLVTLTFKNTLGVWEAFAFTGSHTPQTAIKHHAGVIETDSALKLNSGYLDKDLYTWLKPLVFGGVAFLTTLNESTVQYREVALHDVTFLENEGEQLFGISLAAHFIPVQLTQKP